MGMSVGESDDEGTIGEINTTPLVDVMLVLLIIFLIAVPVAIQTAPITLAKETSIPTTTKPENINISVDKDGNYYWNAAKIEGGKQEMREKVVEAVVAAVKGGLDVPEVHIRADKDTPYEYVGGAQYQIQTAGIPKVAFISEPSEGFAITR